MHLCRRILSDGRVATSSRSQILMRLASSNHPSTSSKVAPPLMLSATTSNSFSPANPPAVRAHAMQLEPVATPNGTIPRSISEELKQYTDYKSYERRGSLKNQDGLGLSFDETEELATPEPVMWQADTSDSSIAWVQQGPVPDVQRPTTPHQNIFPGYAAHITTSGPTGQASSLSHHQTPSGTPTYLVPVHSISPSPPRRNTLPFPMPNQESGSYTPMMLASGMSPAASPMMLDTPGQSPSHSPSRSHTPQFFSLHSPARPYDSFGAGTPSPVMLFANLTPESFPRQGANNARTFMTTAYIAEPAKPASPVTPSKNETAERSSSKGKGSKKEKEPKEKPKSSLNPPKLPPSAWQIFFKEYLTKVKEEDLIGKKINIVDISKAASAAYKDLPLAQMEALTQRQRKLKDAYRREYANWEKTLTPGDIRLENAYRKAQRKAGDSRIKNMKDPNAPAKPMSPYFCFLKAIRNDPALFEEVYQGSADFKTQSRLAAVKWKGFTDDEKQPYFSESELQRQEYHAKLKEYERQFPSNGGSTAHSESSVIDFSSGGTSAS